MDFSPLTNDQLVGLIKAALAEAACRGQAVALAANKVVIDQAEKSRIEREAVEASRTDIEKAERKRIHDEAVAKARAAGLPAADRARIEAEEADRARKAVEAEERRKAAIKAAASTVTGVPKIKTPEKTRQTELWHAKRTIALLALAALTGVPEDYEFQLHVWKSPSTSERRVYIQGGAHGANIEVCYYVDGNAKQPPGALTGARRYDKPGLIAVAKLAAGRFHTVKIDLRQAAAWQPED